MEPDDLIELLTDTLAHARDALPAPPEGDDYCEFGPADCDLPLKQAEAYFEAKARAERDAFRAAGLCVGCGEEKPAPSAELCAGCEAFLAALERRAEGE